MVRVVYTVLPNWITMPNWITIFSKLPTQLDSMVKNIWCNFLAYCQLLMVAKTQQGNVASRCAIISNLRSC
jgi:hypothetical protein